MEAWLADPIEGNFWIMDVDGWFYWNGLIEEKSATSLLLNTTNLPMHANLDYVIHIDADFFTAGNLPDYMTDEAISIFGVEEVEEADETVEYRIRIEAINGSDGLSFDETLNLWSGINELNYIIIIERRIGNSMWNVVDTGYVNWVGEGIDSWIVAENRQLDVQEGGDAELQASFTGSNDITVVTNILLTWSDVSTGGSVEPYEYRFVINEMPVLNGERLEFESVTLASIHLNATFERRLGDDQWSDVEILGNVDWEIIGSSVELSDLELISESNQSVTAQLISGDFFRDDHYVIVQVSYNDVTVTVQGWARDR